MDTKSKSKSKTWTYATVETTPQGFFVLADDIGEFEKNWHCGPDHALDRAVYGPFERSYQAEDCAFEVARGIVFDPVEFKKMDIDPTITMSNGEWCWNWSWAHGEGRIVTIDEGFVDDYIEKTGNPVDYWDPDPNPPRETNGDSAFCPDCGNHISDECPWWCPNGIG